MRELVVTDPRVVSDPSTDFAHVMGAVLASTGPTDVALVHAPFELVAIVNRVDLSTLGRPGELRFVYGLVSAGVPRPFSVAIELDLPPSRTIEQWAVAWHRLGTLSGDAHTQATLALSSEVLAQPLHGQIRTQDATVAPPVLQELDVRPGSPLVRSPLFNQPAPNLSPQPLPPVDRMPHALDTSTSAAALASFVSTHEDQILADEEVVPTWMLAVSIQVTATDPALPGIDPALARAFALTTCRGCHASQPTLDGTFHISPLRRGQAALSPFLLGSGAATGELSRRAEVLRGLVCDSD